MRNFRDFCKKHRFSIEKKDRNFLIGKFFDLTFFFFRKMSSKLFLKKKVRKLIFFQISQKLLKILSCYILNFYELYKHILRKNIKNRKIFQYKNFTFFPKNRQKQGFSPLCSTQYSCLLLSSPLHSSLRYTRRPPLILLYYSVIYQKINSNIDFTL